MSLFCGYSIISKLPKERSGRALDHGRCAPEVLRSQSYNEKSDVYSFGVSSISHGAAATE